jgi:hypothetical protein
LAGGLGVSIFGVSNGGYVPAKSTFDRYVCASDRWRGDAVICEGVRSKRIGAFEFCQADG